MGNLTVPVPRLFAHRDFSASAFYCTVLISYTWIQSHLGYQRIHLWLSCTKQVYLHIVLLHDLQCSGHIHSFAGDVFITLIPHWYFLLCFSINRIVSFFLSFLYLPMGTFVQLSTLSKFWSNECYLFCWACLPFYLPVIHTLLLLLQKRKTIVM